ncbi:MAG: FadR family transcriptional regulator [Planctomycetes bacterium]|nr:FadR family transcriptional regulator [Planctomycetota bacterium]
MTMTPLKKRPRLYEDIVQQFMQRIEAGELAAGDKLPTERELVEQLGVSRNSVREALRAMELLGLIESRGSEGTFVKHSGIDRTLLEITTAGAADEKRVMEMYQVRLLLETYTARQAARNRTREHLAEMRRAIAALRADIGAGNRGQKGDTRFHRLVAEASGNSVIIGILSLFADAINSSIDVANAHVTVNDIIDEHQQLFDAIEKGDEKGAERIMRAHIRRAHDRTKFIIAANEEKDGNRH